MGAGCDYRLPDTNDVPAYWVPVEPSGTYADDFDIPFAEMSSDIENIVSDLKQCSVGDRVLFYGKLYEISFGSTHQGDVLVIMSVGKSVEPKMRPLAQYHLGTVYAKVIKHINAFHPVCCASSAWTYDRHEVNSLSQ